MKMNKLTFNDFCEYYCDGLYDSKFPLESQCSGYKKLREMVINQITPASLSEMERWENEPTKDELINTPDIKYLRFLHPILRPIIVEHWEKIKTFKVDD